MKTKVITPGDGYEYPFVYCFGKELIDCLPGKEEQLFLAIPNGRFCSNFFTNTETEYSVMEKCQCTVEQAAVILQFIKEVFNESTNNN